MKKLLLSALCAATLFTAMPTKAQTELPTVTLTCSQSTIGIDTGFFIVWFLVTSCDNGQEYWDVKGVEGVLPF